jgi:hypothetical protein
MARETLSHAPKEARTETPRFVRVARSAFALNEAKNRHLYRTHANAVTVAFRDILPLPDGDESVRFSAFGNALRSYSQILNREIIDAVYVVERHPDNATEDQLRTNRHLREYLTQEGYRPDLSADEISRIGNRQGGLSLKEFVLRAEADNTGKNPPSGDLKGGKFTEGDVSLQDTQRVVGVYRVINEDYEKLSDEDKKEERGEFLGGQLSALKNSLRGINNSRPSEPSGASLLPLGTLIRRLNRAGEDVVKLKKGELSSPENRPFYSACLEGNREGFRWILGLNESIGVEPEATDSAPQQA